MINQDDTLKREFTFNDKEDKNQDKSIEPLLEVSQETNES